MEYMLMCCFSEKAWTGLPANEKDRIMGEYGALVQSLAQRGQLRGGGQLRPTSSATTVRVRNGKPVVSDGPFAETKEQLGGYHLVDCKDLDEALAIAARIPTLSAGGAIEVRPLESSLENDLAARR
ncbi:MAG TPA: YciI family protein [Nitrospiraceae bacterium]|nr:YciI family protein [Nitrospiraceae bacterium]